MTLTRHEIQRDAKQIEFLRRIADALERIADSLEGKADGTNNR